MWSEQGSQDEMTGLISATLKRVTRLGPPARTGYLSSAELAPLLRVSGYFLLGKPTADTSDTADTLQSGI